jgi:hypothetical protein
VNSLKNYSTIRLILVGSGVGALVETMRLGIITFVHIDNSSAWAPFITGIVTGIVVLLTVSYFGKNGRDKWLMPRGSKQDETKTNQ